MDLFPTTFVVLNPHVTNVKVRKCKPTIVNNIANAIPIHDNCHEKESATRGTTNSHVHIAILGQLACQLQW
jgi:hypothetical protein